MAPIHRALAECSVARLTGVLAFSCRPAPAQNDYMLEESLQPCLVSHLVPISLCLLRTSWDQPRPGLAEDSMGVGPAMFATKSYRHLGV